MFNLQAFIRVFFGFIIFFSIQASVFADEVHDILLSNGETVQVTYTQKKDGYTYRVEFANGNYYTYSQAGTVGIGSASKDMTDEERQWSTEAIEIYEDEYGKATVTNKKASYFMSVLLIIVGAFLLFAPKGAWYLQIGWRLRNTEPSDLALTANRMIGGILIFIGVIIIF